MNADFEDIKLILLQIKSEYINGFINSNISANIHITERDIVSEIYYRLRLFCSGKNLSSHTEIKPAPSKSTEISDLKRLPRIDNVILKNMDEKTWIQEAVNFQDRYKKGSIEARFSSIPIEFFHTAIEVKIQSYFPDAKKDIDKLKVIQDSNKDCNCFFLLLNARGRIYDHESILEYAKKQNVFIIEYTSAKKSTQYSEDPPITHNTEKEVIQTTKKEVMHSINKKVTHSTNIKAVTKCVSIPRRRRIIQLIDQNFKDIEILRILDKEYPVGTFITSNYAALYGTKRDLGLKVML